MRRYYKWFLLVLPLIAFAAYAQKSVIQGISSTGVVRDIRTNNVGELTMVGPTAAGATASANPVLVAGSDGTLVRTMVTDTTGRQIVVGTAAAGAAVAGNPLLMGGSDGTNARSLTVDTGGRAQVNLSDDTDVASVNSSSQLEVSAANALPTGLDWVYATTTDFANCGAGGSASNTIAAGTWQLGVFDETVWICYAATCAAGGRRVPASTVLVVKVPSLTTISCRSTGATGDLEYTLLR